MLGGSGGGGDLQPVYMMRAPRRKRKLATDPADGKTKLMNPNDLDYTTTSEGAGAGFCLCAVLILVAGCLFTFFDSGFTALIAVVLVFLVVPFVGLITFGFP